MRARIASSLVLEIALLTSLVACGQDNRMHQAASPALQLEIECRKARITALRMPLLERSLYGLPLGAAGVTAVREAVQGLAVECEQGDPGPIAVAEANLLHHAGQLAEVLALEVKLTVPEASLIIEGRLRRAKNELIDRCQTRDQADVFEISNRRFESQIIDISLGACAAAWGPASGATGLPAGTTSLTMYSGQVQACMTAFLENSERRQGQECGSGIAPVDGSFQQVGNKNTEEYSYVDEDGNEHRLIVETWGDSEDVTLRDITCSGACQPDGEGGYSNVVSGETSIYTDKGDGSGYVTTIDNEGNTTGRPTGSGNDSPNVTDAAGSSDTDSQALKQWEDCLFTPGCDPGERPQECLAIPVDGGASIMYLVQSGDSPQLGARLPVTALEALDGCMCAAREAAGFPELPGVLGSADRWCGTTEDQARLRCMGMPFGPDDEPLQCAQMAEADMSGTANISCSMMQCPEGSFRSLISGSRDSAACGCACRTFVQGFFQGRSSPACSQMMCPAGSCVCGPTGCGCSSAGLVPALGSGPGGMPTPAPINSPTLPYQPLPSQPLGGV